MLNKAGFMIRAEDNCQPNQTNVIKIVKDVQKKQPKLEQACMMNDVGFKDMPNGPMS